MARILTIEATVVRQDGDRLRPGEFEQAMQDFKAWLHEWGYECELPGHPDEDILRIWRDDETLTREDADELVDQFDEVLNHRELVTTSMGYLLA